MSYQQVEEFLAGLPDLPSIFFCVASGTADKMEFLIDLTAAQLRNCFTKNYFSAAFMTQSLMRRWIKNPVSSQLSPRHIIVTGSTAALVSLPGYAAYTPTKRALRALADTVRQETLMFARHSCPLRFPRNRPYWCLLRRAKKQARADGAAGRI